MATEPPTQDSGDGMVIGLTQEWEVRFWTQQLRCTAEELRQAIAVVGDSAQAVRKHLSR